MFNLFLAFLTNPDDINKISKDINSKFNGKIKIDNTLKFKFEKNRQQI